MVTGDQPVKIEIQSQSGRIIGKGNYGMKSRALWYLRKDLADVIVRVSAGLVFGFFRKANNLVIEDSNEAFRIRLRFEPQRWLDELRQRYSYLLTSVAKSTSKKAPSTDATRIVFVIKLGIVVCFPYFAIKQSLRWYVKRGWATLREDSDQKYIIDLTIEKCQLNQFYRFLYFYELLNIKLERPNSNSEKYYTTEKENQCVVCSSTEQLIRKNVVPREYRKHFPTVMKTHVSHDIVLLCLKVEFSKVDFLNFLFSVMHGQTS